MRRPFVGLWLSTPGLVLMWATPSENGGTVFLHAVSQLSCHEDNIWHKLCSWLCDMFAFQRTDVRKVLSTETVSAAARQHALLRRSAWAPIYTAWMDATAQMVRLIIRCLNEDVIINFPECLLLWGECKWAFLGNPECMLQLFVDGFNFSMTFMTRADLFHSWLLFGCSQVRFCRMAPVLQSLSALVCTMVQDILWVMYWSRAAVSG